MTGDNLNTFLRWLVILIAIACVSWAAISIYKHFHPQPPVFNPSVLKDSVTQREREMGHVIDSLISRNNYIVTSADSLKLVVIQQQIQLDKRKDLTESLSDQYKEYRRKYDTINALHKCDTLVAENAELRKAADDYEYSNARLYDSLSGTVGINSLILAKKDYLYSTLRFSFDSLAFEYEKQTSQLQKAHKPKRWGIGLQTGVTYDKGIRVLPAIGISYNIIRF